jgi:hypothetical protein
VEEKKDTKRFRSLWGGERRTSIACNRLRLSRPRLSRPIDRQLACPSV